MGVDGKRVTVLNNSFAVSLKMLVTGIKLQMIHNFLFFLSLRYICSLICFHVPPHSLYAAAHFYLTCPASSCLRTHASAARCGDSDTSTLKTL
jgi:hypothetical protein